MHGMTSVVTGDRIRIFVAADQASVVLTTKALVGKLVRNSKSENIGA